MRNSEQTEPYILSKRDGNRQLHKTDQPIDGARKPGNHPTSQLMIGHNGKFHQTEFPCLYTSKMVEANCMSKKGYDPKESKLLRFEEAKPNAGNTQWVIQSR